MSGKSKLIFTSKTFGVATLNVVALKFWPDLRVWAQDNLDAYIEILTATMLVLRYVSKSAVHALPKVLTPKKKTKD